MATVGEAWGGFVGTCGGGRPGHCQRQTPPRPLLSSRTVKPGSVRNIIQHFENNQHHEGPDPGGTQRLSTGSFPEDLLEVDRWG